MNIDAYLDPKYGIYDYLMKQKASGRIRHLGFSAHGAYPVLKRFLDAYGKDMEFCQLQINYLDWDFQDAKAKVELLKETQHPVWVMEPLRGGKLAHLAPEYEARLRPCARRRASPPGRSAFCRACPRWPSRSRACPIWNSSRPTSPLLRKTSPSPMRRWKRCSPSPKR